ncbi:50S ribosomal protein L30 [Candidatus Sulcia muelleri]|uniref:50S ribosomal protein L30 n=1 Tax=Candidatus Karelsulcia muelleri TaxID=336810 RepID=UPI001FA695CE|nr:50S ribosomal protein L30 [Candidatus Karelsulcia muelleri]NHU72515.1 50S ribosomal protein L30 [Candidatus Karelsulcia muelleri]
MMKILLKKSSIKKSKSQKLTLLALGLKKLNSTVEKKLNSTVEHILTPSIMGMIKKVSHLLLINNENYDIK